MYNNFGKDSTQNSSGVFYFQPKPNSICITQGVVAISFVKHAKSTPKVIIHPILAL